MSFRIIPSIYLKDGKVVNKNTMEIVGDGDAVALATLYNNRGADELIIFDISETDSQHDNNIGTMVSIADAVDIPILVGGNIKRLEDVKKYNVDVFVMGDDWKGKFDFLKDYCEVVYLPRTEGISTTQLKEELKG